MPSHQTLYYFYTAFILFSSFIAVTVSYDVDEYHPLQNVIRDFTAVTVSYDIKSKTPIADKLASNLCIF